MALKTKVFIKNITNLSEARYCAGMGVHFLAFPAPQVTPKLYHDITGWIQGPEMVLDVSSCKEVPTTINEYDCQNILIRIDQINLIAQYPSSSFLVVLNSLLPHDLDDLQSPQVTYAIANGLTEGEMELLGKKDINVIVELGEDAIQTLGDLLKRPIAGVMLTGSNELQPGLKEYDHLSDVLEQLEINED
jgi:phosphoribosylanthranilate isomerase